MASAVYDPAEAKVTAVIGNIFVEVVVGNETAHDILAAGDEATRLYDRPDTHLRKICKVPLLIAIAVDRTSKATGLEVRHEVIEIFWR